MGVSTTNPVARPPRKWHWRRWLCAGIAAALALAAGYLGLLYYLVGRDLREALALTDRLDPAWHWEDLLRQRDFAAADRRAEEFLLLAERLLAHLPEADSALTARAYLDLGWMKRSPRAALDPAEVPEFERLRNRARSSLQLAAAEWRQADDHAELSRPTDPFVRSPRCARARELADGLAAQGLLQIDAGDINGALETSGCLIMLVGVLGDEPLFTTQTERARIAGLSARLIERALSRGQPDEMRLVELERRLAREEDSTLALVGARACRIGWEELLENFRTGKSNDRLPGPVAGVLARTSRPPILRLNTQIVEITKLPLTEQLPRLRTLLLAAEHEQPLFARLYLFPKIQKLSSDLIQDQLQFLLDLRLARLGLAAERYRQSHGKLPMTATDLVPHFIPEPLIDPASGQAIRMRPVSKGLILFSPGPDGREDGATLELEPDPKKANPPAFRLWEATERHTLPRSP